MRKVTLLNLILIAITACGLAERTKEPKSDNAYFRLSSDSTLVTGWYYVTMDKSKGFKRQLDRSEKYFYLDPYPIVTKKNFTTLEVYQDNSGSYGLTMKLDENGTQAWAVATEKSIGKNLAFVLNDKLLYLPRVNSKIEFGVTALNRGDLSRDELEAIKDLIRGKE